MYFLRVNDTNVLCLVDAVIYCEIIEEDLRRRRIRGERGEDYLFLHIISTVQYVPKGEVEASLDCTVQYLFPYVEHIV